MGDAGDQLIEDLMRLKPAELTANAWAVRAGVSRTIWADIRRHGNPSRRTLEKLLAAIDSHLAEFEALRFGPYAEGQNETSDTPPLGEVARSWRRAPMRPLPVIESASHGEWGGAGSRIELLRIMPDRVIGQVPRPASLAADTLAFAMTVIGDSMWPRYRPGRRVAVSPAAPVSVGDDVLVSLRPVGTEGKECLLKELVKRSVASLDLRQFSPDTTFAVSSERIEAVYKVIGELI